MGYSIEGVEGEEAKKVSPKAPEISGLPLVIGDKSKAKPEEKKKPKKTIYQYSEEEIKALTEKLLKLKHKDQSKITSLTVLAVYSGTITAMGMDFSKPLDEASNQGEVMEFDSPCYACGAKGKNRMCVCSIPHFKEIIVMCFACESCGYKFSEVKGGGGISEKGRKLTLLIKSPEDFSRDLYKVFPI